MKRIEKGEMLNMILLMNRVAILMSVLPEIFKKGDIFLASRLYEHLLLYNSH